MLAVGLKQFVTLLLAGIALNIMQSINGFGAGWGTNLQQLGIALVSVVILLVLIICLPTWPYSAGWGYYPSGGLGAIVVILLILALVGAI